MTFSLADLKKRTTSFSDRFSKYAEEKTTSNKSNFKDERFWAPTFDKEKGGSAVIRFLPSADLDAMPFTEVITHFFRNGDAVYSEKSLRSINQKDPVAELNNRLWNTGLDSDKAQAKEQKQRKKFYSNILVIKDSANPENNGKVFLYEYGPAIFNKIELAMFPQDGEDPKEVFSPFEGCNFNIKITPQALGKSIVPNYTNSYFSDKTEEIDDVEEVMNQVYDLKEFSDHKNFKSYDELAEKLVDVLGYTTGSGVETVVGYGKKLPSKSKVSDDLEDDMPFEVDLPKSKPSKKVEIEETDDDDDEIARMKKLLEEMDD